MYRADSLALLQCIGVEKDVLEKEYRHANNGGLSRKHIFDAVDASLKRLDVEYIGTFAPSAPVDVC